MGVVASAPINKRNNTFYISLSDIKIVKMPTDFDENQYPLHIVRGKNHVGFNAGDYVCIFSEAEKAGGNEKYSIKDIQVSLLDPCEKGFVSPKILRIYEI